MPEESKQKRQRGGNANSEERRSWEEGMVGLPSRRMAERAHGDVFVISVGATGFATAPFLDVGPPFAVYRRA